MLGHVDGCSSLLNDVTIFRLYNQGDDSNRLYQNSGCCGMIILPIWDGLNHLVNHGISASDVGCKVLPPYCRCK